MALLKHLIFKQLGRSLKNMLSIEGLVFSFAVSCSSDFCSKSTVETPFVKLVQS